MSPQLLWHRKYLEGGRLTSIMMSTQLSQPLRETLLCLFFLFLICPILLSFFLLFCILHSLSPPPSLPTRLYVPSLCYIRAAAEEAERVNRHEGIEPRDMERKQGGYHQQNMEKNHPDRRNQTANGPCNGVC